MWTNIQRFLIRLIASRHLAVMLSFGGAWFLTKELFFGVLEHFWKFEHSSAWQLGTDVAIFLFFFIVSIIVFRFTHADHYLQLLTLGVIRDLVSYFAFFQKFTSDRIGRLAERYKSGRFIEEVEALLKIGEERFGLHHKRSVCFLLGLDYPHFKSVMQELEELENEWPKSPKEDRGRLKSLQGEIRKAISEPLECLFGPSSTFQYARTSKTEHLIKLWKISAQPSYEEALRMFSEELKKPLDRLKDRVSTSTSPGQCKQIVKETKALLSFFAERGKGRLGFPLYDFIEHKKAKLLDCFERHGESSGQQARRSLSEISQKLEEFLLELQDNFREWDCGLKGLSQNPKIKPGEEVVCLYGFSKTVKSFLNHNFRQEERGKVGFILIETDRLATTTSEEHKMRDELLDMGFADISILSSRDFLLFKKFHKPLSFCLGYEVIDGTAGRTVCHFGAGQILRQLITSLSDNDNTVKVYLIGSGYKEIPFHTSDSQVQHASIFDFGTLTGRGNVGVEVIRAAQLKLNLNP